MKTTHLPFLVAAALGLSACGSLVENPNELEPLAQMNGTLVVKDGATVPGAVRVALVWRTDGQEKKSGGGFNVAEDLEVKPQFPARFQLSLQSPPPSSALYRPGDGVDLPIAVGSIVAYEDKNQNERLDLVGAKATSFVDAIVGANEELLVVWFSQAPTGTAADELRDSQGRVPRGGYNLYRRHEPICSVIVGVPGDAKGSTQGEEASSGSMTPMNEPNPEEEACDGSRVIEWLPIDASFELPITSDPKFNQLMCESLDEGVAPNELGGSSPSPEDTTASPRPKADSNVSSGTEETPADPPSPGTTPNGGVSAGASGIPQGPFPAPGTPGLDCFPDGRGYTFGSCNQPGLCEIVGTCAAEAVELPEGAAPPTGWPCPIAP